jgi:hypothetical protein
MKSPSESSSSEPSSTKKDRQLPKWFKVSAIAAGSALAGGIAAAWFFRNTLETLRAAEEDPTNPDFRIPGSHRDEDT